MHAEHATPADGSGWGGYGERAETYLRLLAESVLRPSAARDANCVRRAAGILVEAGLLSDELTAQILADLQLALRVRAVPLARSLGTRLRLLKGFQAVQDLGARRPAAVLAGLPWRPGDARLPIDGADHHGR